MATTIQPPSVAAAVSPAISPREGFCEFCRWLIFWLPLLPIAAGLMAGIVWDWCRPAPWWVYVCVFAAAGLSLAAAWRARQWGFPLAVAALVLAAGAVGGLRHQVTFWRVSADHVLRHVAGENVLARLRGQVVDEPVIRQIERGEYDIPMSDRPRTSFMLEAGQILTETGWADCEGLVRVSVQGPADHVHQGDAVEIYAALRMIDGPRNPGEYDWRLYNRRYGLYVAGSVRQPASIVARQEAGGGSLRRWIGWFRQRCRVALLDGIAADEPEAGLLATYVAGQRSAVSRSINEAFRRSGTAHLLAVSGSHVALISTVVGVAGVLLLRRPRRAALLAFGAVIFFSLLVEPSAPSLRAAIMALLAVAGMLLRRPFNIGNWLAGSAGVLLLVNPAELFSPGFQMTFSAVIALGVLTRAVCTFLFGPWDLAGWVRLRIRLSEGPTRWGRGSLTVKNALSYSVAAWLANFPLTMWHFGQLNPYGPIATVLILPLASATLVLGFCKLLLGLLWPSMGQLLAWPVEWLAGAMGWMAGWLGSWPGAHLAAPSPPGWLLVVLYVVLFGWAMSARRRWYEAWPLSERYAARRTALLTGEQDTTKPGEAGGRAGGLVPYRPIRPIYVLLVAIALLGAYGLTAWPGRPGHLRMHVLSVGDGLCVLVRYPDGRNLLYDCGSLTIGGVGERIVVPALQALGVRRLDAVVLSHGDLDHYSGLVDVAKAVPVSRVCTSEAVLRVAEQGTPRKLLRELAGLGVEVERLASGDRVLGGSPITTEILWPPAGTGLAIRDSNDTCLVVRISCGGKRILLPGDIGPYAQGLLAGEQAEAIRAEVLLLPHHGSPKTLDGRFVEAVGPQVAIASCKDSSRAALAARFLPADGRALDTHSQGMVTVELGPGGPRVSAFTQGFAR